MTSHPNGVPWRPYLRALVEAGLDVASAAGWIAAAELPPARRRLARTALAAAIAATTIPGLRADRSAAVTPTDSPRLPYVDVGIRLPAAEPPDNDGSSRRRAVAVGTALTAAAAVTVGTTMASRYLERRWLARLTRNGHPHPHRALAIRVAALYALVAVPSRLLAVRSEAPVHPEEPPPPR
ncbi:hypothetical protein M1L60_45135 [Actinoplanes sp. TRM 88003]|uniref:Uncharacterized protein n=1 Tax=Paractinoplanes aksuensis TaxID=2939490 RepID=A0ABT1E6K4_9ACTN|nr:hypothetical protein [Actinoplanes aksuensis]MCO8277780.1 hypothetical protein [Actinoplanes aksuensis]